MHLNRDQKLAREKEAKNQREEKELQQCTFHPRTNRKKNKQISSKYKHIFQPNAEDLVLIESPEKG